MESIKNNKGQVIIIGAFILALTLISLTVVINSYIFSNNVDEIGKGSYEIRKLGDYNSEINKNIRIAVSPPAPLSPNQAENNYRNYMNSYTKQSNNFHINNTGSIFNYSEDSITTNWEVGNINSSHVEDKDDNTDWIITEDFSTMRNAYFDIETSSSSNFKMIGETQTVNGGSTVWEERWKMVVSENSIEFTSSSGSTNSYPISGNSVEVDILLNEVDGSSADTFFSDLLNSGRVRFENGDTVESIYSLQFDSSSVIQNPCSNPCVVDENTYQTGVISSLSFKYSLNSTRTNIIKDSTIERDIEQMVIDNAG